MNTTVVILAAGQGKRMVSDQPKVLHLIGGRPLLEHVLTTANAINAARSVVVYGHGGETVRAAFADYRAPIDWVEQKELLGTGHAVAQTLDVLPDDAVVLVLYGDVPLIQAQTLAPLIASAAGDRLGLLTVELEAPDGYGRIVRDADGAVARIVEHKDASPEQLQVREVNTGIVSAPAKRLKAWVESLGNDNVQGEYYLTDVIEMAVRDGVPIDAIKAADPLEVQGINDRVQLAELERYYQRRQTAKLMLSGATLIDPARVDVRGNVTVGRDVVIEPNVIFEGEVSLGDRAKIGAGCVIRQSSIGADSELLPHCVIEHSEIGKQVVLGPFARLRPGNRLADKSKVGNFVELKNTALGEGAKANHLSYLGDSEVGRLANVGAGTITCNYDGANKHKTVIEEEVHIGSNNSLVAPIRVGRKSTTGAGSTLSKDVPEDVLIVTRMPPRQIKGWKRPVKKKT